VVKGLREGSKDVRGIRPRGDRVPHSGTRTQSRSESNGPVESEEIKALGGAIRSLRQQRGLSLRELSDATGLSTGFLSLVERGLSAPALTSLYSIARALGTDAGYFFPRERSPEESPALRHVSYSGEPARTAVLASNRIYRMLSSRAPDRILEPLHVTIQPSDADVEAYAHDGEEFCYVLCGDLVCEVDGSRYELRPGDSIHIASTVPHAIRNEGEQSVEAIWVLTPPLFK
jgi:transcriptional regulator with XRE-family HTH domain